MTQGGWWNPARFGVVCVRLFESRRITGTIVLPPQLSVNIAVIEQQLHICHP